ncbi:MAG: hypothetical protein V1777_05160 [Candidatus Micrarchaeota archaeon]
MTQPNALFEAANTRFEWANKACDEDEFGLAGQLYINSAIRFTDFLCQKYLGEIFSRKHHSNTSFIHQLTEFLKNDYKVYKESYEFLMNQKNLTDYGNTLSESQLKQIKRRATKIKEIAEQHYSI